MGIPSKLPSLDDCKPQMPDLAPVEIPSVQDFSEYTEETPLDDLDYLDEDSEELEEYNDETETEVSLPPQLLGGNLEDPLDNELVSEHEPTEEDYDKFTDKENLKIIPFGGKKANRSKKELIKSSDFDDRKNAITTHKIIRTISIVAIAVIFALGIKNTWFPENIYTKKEIEQISMLSIGRTGFPSNRGQAFASDFITAYLTIDPAGTADDTALEYFYTGQENVRTTVRRREISGKETQKVIISPQVFSIQPVSQQIESYKLSALVTDLTGSAESTSDGQSNARWVSFSVDVYYNTKTDTLSIAPNSPTVIPKYPIANSAKLPKPAIIGNGESGEALLPALTPTIDGYITAYTRVNANSWNEIAQYISATPELSLYSGFGGDMILAGSPADSIAKVVWLTGTEGEYKIDVTVKLKDNRSQAAGMSIGHTARYIMTVISTIDGKYIVTGFKPYVYVPLVE